MIAIQEILGRLPHRYPILLIDRLLEVSEDGTKGRGLKNVTFNEPYFQGHYPGTPIMPGVLIIEAMAQTVGAIIMMNPEYSDCLPILGGVDGAKFRRMVVPGDQLILDLEIMWMRNMIGKAKGVAQVDGEIAATAEMTFKLSRRQG